MTEDLLRARSSLSSLATRLVSRLADSRAAYSDDDLDRDLGLVLSEILAVSGARVGWLGVFCDGEGRVPSPEEHAARATHVRGRTAGLTLGWSETTRGTLGQRSQLPGLRTHVARTRRNAQVFWDAEAVRELEEKGVLRAATREDEIELLERMRRETAPAGEPPGAWERRIDALVERARDRPPDERYFEQVRRMWDERSPIVRRDGMECTLEEWFPTAVFPVVRRFGEEEQCVGEVVLALVAGRRPEEPLAQERMERVQEVVDLVSVPLAVAVSARQLAEGLARERALRDELSRERRLSALRGLTGQLAHDVNNAAAVVDSSLRAAQRALGEKDVVRLAREEPPLERALERAWEELTTARRALESVTDTVQRSRTSVAADLFRPREVDLNAELERWALPGVTRRRGEGVGTVVCDPELLYRAVLNAVANARRAVEERVRSAGGGAGEVVVSTERTGASVVVAIADDGVGMPPEALAKLEAGEAFTTKVGGAGVTGLGTGILRTIAETHGGSVTWTSAPGRGTTVRIHLPAA